MCVERAPASAARRASGRTAPFASAAPFARRGPNTSGQALVEVLVGALALVPLFVLVVWLGKIDSIRQAGIAASRSLAFECTVRPEDCAESAAHPELADELRRRVFSRIDVPVLTHDRAADAASERNPLWVDRANSPLIERFADVGARVDLERFNAGESLATSRAGPGVADPMGLLSHLAGPGRFGLEIDRGLVNARVQVRVSASAPNERFAGQLASIPLRIKANTAVLTDAWNASGPYGDAGSVERRVRLGSSLGAYDATLAARYAPTRGFIRLMDLIGLEPLGSGFRYHAPDVDVVPQDRIAAPDTAGTQGAAR